jgi:hypothetical protein
MNFTVIAIEDYHDGASRCIGFGPNLLPHFFGDTASLNKPNPFMRKLVHFLEIDREHTTFSHQIKQVSIEQSGSAAICSALDQKVGFYLGNGFLNGP